MATLPPSHLSIYDPISQGFINLDGGVLSTISVLYQILVELRTMNQFMQQVANPDVDDVATVRADQSVAEPQFTSPRG